MEMASVVQMLNYNNRRIIDAVTDYLYMLKKQVEMNIKEMYPLHVRSGAPRHYMLSVPAFWGREEKHLITIAAGRAKMSNVRLIGEPQAAALSTLSALPENIAYVDQNIVVCDAGGGTEDMAPYQIQQVSPLRLTKIAGNVGGLCGSAFLNMGFGNVLKARLGMTKYLWILENHPRALRTAMTDFDEEAKRTFQLHDNQSEYQFELSGVPDDHSVGIYDEKINLTANEMSVIFESVVSEIMQLVRKQVELIETQGMKIHAFILVGGFGQNEYLAGKLLQFCQSVNPQIRLLRGPYPWSAVVRGAVIRRHRDMEMQERQANLSYGVSNFPIFDPALHSIDNKIYDELSGKYCAKDIIEWLVLKGDLISPKRSVDIDMSFNWNPRISLVRFKKEIYTSDDRRPSNTFTGPVKKVGTLLIDLSNAPEDALRCECDVSGEIRYATLRAKIRATLNTAGIELSCNEGNVQYGKAQLKFEGEHSVNDRDDTEGESDDGSFIQDDGEGDEDDGDRIDAVDSDEE